MIYLTEFSNSKQTTKPNRSLATSRSEGGTQYSLHSAYVGFVAFFLTMASWLTMPMYTLQNAKGDIPAIRNNCLQLYGSLL